MSAILKLREPCRDFAGNWIRVDRGVLRYSGESVKTGSATCSTPDRTSRIRPVAFYALAWFLLAIAQLATGAIS